MMQPDASLASHDTERLRGAKLLPPGARWSCKWQLLVLVARPGLTASASAFGGEACSRPPMPRKIPPDIHKGARVTRPNGQERSAAGEHDRTTVAALRWQRYGGSATVAAPNKNMAQTNKT